MFLDWCEILMRGIPGADEETNNQAKAETGMKVYGYFSEEVSRRDEIGPPKTGDETQADSDR